MGMGEKLRKNLPFGCAHIPVLRYGNRTYAKWESDLIYKDNKKNDRVGHGDDR